SRLLVDAADPVGGQRVGPEIDRHLFLQWIPMLLLIGLDLKQRFGQAKRRVSGRGRYRESERIRLSLRRPAVARADEGVAKLRQLGRVPLGAFVNMIENEVVEENKTEVPPK